MCRLLLSLAPPSNANSTMIALVIAFPASELLLSHCSLIASTQIVLPRQQCQLLPAERIIFMISSAAKKRKLSVEQNFQRILAQDAATSANENRVNNEFPPDERMVESCDANETQPPPPMKTESTMNSLLMNVWLKVAMPMNACSNVTTIMTAAEALPMTHFPIATQVSCWQGMIQCHLRMMIKMISFLMTSIFGLEATDDGTTDDGQSLKTTSASCHGANIDGNPQVMMYQYKEEKPPTAEDDIEFTNLEVAELELCKTLVSSFVVERQRVIKFKHLNVVFTFLHAIKCITNHHLNLFSLFIIFHLVEYSKTKDNSTALNRLG
jgi:hypothetical protein